VLPLIHTVFKHLSPYAYSYNAPTFAAWKQHIGTKYYSHVTTRTCGWTYGSATSIFKGGHRVVTCQIRQTERTVNHNNMLAKTSYTVAVNHNNTIWTTAVIDDPVRFSVFVRLTADQTCFYSSQLPCKQIIFTWHHIIPRSLTISLAYMDLPHFLFFFFFFLFMNGKIFEKMYDKMDIFFSTVAWSIWNPKKIGGVL